MTHSLNCAAQCSLHNLVPMEPHPEQGIWLAEIEMVTQEAPGPPSFHDTSNVPLHTYSSLWDKTQELAEWLLHLRGNTHTKTSRKAWDTLFTRNPTPIHSDSKEFACNAGDPWLTPGSGRSLGEGNGNPLQYSCLENSMDRGAWQATVHGVTESDTTEWLSLSFSTASLAPHNQERTPTPRFSPRAKGQTPKTPSSGSHWWHGSPSLLHRAVPMTQKKVCIQHLAQWLHTVKSQ